MWPTESPPPHQSGNSEGNERGAQASNGTGQNHGKNSTNGHATTRNGDHWSCTEGQKGLILRVVNESGLDKLEIEQMSQQLFGVGVKQCNKGQASQLIEELLERTGRKTNSRSRWRQAAGGRT